MSRAPSQVDCDNVLRKKIRLDSQARNTDQELHNTMMVVCDPNHDLTLQERKEILTALGLIPDPKHVEMTWMGRQRGT